MADPERIQKEIEIFDSQEELDIENCVSLRNYAEEHLHLLKEDES